MSHYTVSCSGCFEAGENMGRAGDYCYDEKAGCYLGAGCSECGYTGKRRSELRADPSRQEARRSECGTERERVTEMAQRSQKMPTEYVDGIWVVPGVDGPEPQGIVALSTVDGPELPAGWTWWVLGKVGTARSYAEACDEVERHVHAATHNAGGPRPLGG